MLPTCMLIARSTRGALAAARHRADGFLHAATPKGLTPACKFFYFSILIFPSATKFVEKV